MRTPIRFVRVAWMVRRILHRHAVWPLAKWHILRLTWRRLQLRTSGRGNCKLVAISLVEQLGDIVAAEPVARYLRKRAPGAHIVWFVRRPFASLLTSNPNVDEVVRVVCLSEWIRIAKSVPFDETVDLHFHGRTCHVCKELYSKPTGDCGVTLSNYLDHGGLLPAFCRSAGLPELNEQPEAHIPQRTVDRVNRMNLPGKFVAICGGSSMDTKNWREDKWCELVGRIDRELDVETVEIGLTSAMPGLKDARYRSLCGRTQVLDMAEVIRRALVFVGIDSGPAHLANALRKPGVVLLGQHAAFQSYMPFTGCYAEGRGAEIVRVDGSVADIPVSRVFDAVARALQRCHRP